MNSLMKAFLIMAVASANGMVTSASSGVHIVSLAPAPPYYIPPIDNIFYDVHRSPFPGIEALFSHLCLFVVAALRRVSSFILPTAREVSETPFGELSISKMVTSHPPTPMPSPSPCADLNDGVECSDSEKCCCNYGGPPQCQNKYTRNVCGECSTGSSLANENVYYEEDDDNNENVEEGGHKNSAINEFIDAHDDANDGGSRVVVAKGGLLRAALLVTEE